MRYRKGRRSSDWFFAFLEQFPAPASMTAIELMADELLGDNADFQLLRRIPGIGPINGLTIIAEVGDLRRFSHHRQLDTANNRVFCD